MFQNKSVAVTGREWRSRLEAAIKGGTDAEVWFVSNGGWKIAEARYRGAPIQTAYLADGTEVHFAVTEDFTILEMAEALGIPLTPHAICRRNIQ